MCILFITPVFAQNPVQINYFTSHPGIYFDPIEKGRLFSNTWNLIGHYNMSYHYSISSHFNNMTFILNKVCIKQAYCNDTLLEFKFQLDQIKN